MSDTLSGTLETDSFPMRAIITDDPLRIKMLAAHHLDNAVIKHEQGDELVYTGNYRRTAVALISAGFEQDAVPEYLRLAKQYGVEEIIYIGECVSASRLHPLRSVILAEGGDRALLERSYAAASRSDIRVTVQPVLTHGSAAGDFGGATDAITKEIYVRANENGIAAISVLTVSENTETGEKMEEHERRSRLYPAALLVFETLAGCEAAQIENGKWKMKMENCRTRFFI